MLRLLAILLSLAIATPAAAAWQRARSAHFIVYADAGEAWLTDYVRALERYDMLLRLSFQIDDDTASAPLSVFVLNSVGQVQAAGPRVKNVAGFYAAGPGGALVVVPKSTGGAIQSAEIVLRHEYAHHLMMHYFPAAYPAWYIEGFADFVSTATFDTRNLPSLGAPPAARWLAAKNGPRLGLEKLLTIGAHDLTDYQRGAFYAESWLLTHYLNLTPARAGQLAHYLDLLNEGKAGREAAIGAFGDLKTLQDDFDRYRQQSSLRYYRIANPLVFSGAIALSPLDPAEAETIGARLALTHGVDKDHRAAVVAALQKALVHDPNSAGTLTLLARAQLNLRAYDAAEAAADKALAIDPAQGRAALWKGLAIVGRLRDAGDKDAEKWKAARRWIIQANRADPSDPVPLRENFRIYRLLGLEPSQIAKDGLAQSYRLLPQNVGLRFEYAALLAQDGKPDAAIALLKPVANAPHGSPAPQAAAASRMIAGIEEAKARGATMKIDPPSEPEAEEDAPPKETIGAAFPPEVLLPHGAY